MKMTALLCALLLALSLSSLPAVVKDPSSSPAPADTGTIVPTGLTFAENELPAVITRADGNTFTCRALDGSDRTFMLNYTEVSYYGINGLNLNARIVLVTDGIPEDLDTVAEHTERILDMVHYALAYEHMQPNAPKNTMRLYISGYDTINVEFPEGIPVGALVSASAVAAAVRYRPYPAEGSQVGSRLRAEQATVVPFAFGAITEYTEGAVTICPLEPWAYFGPNSEYPTDERLTFTLTPYTLHTGYLTERQPVAVVYDEETMEALAFFYSNG